MKVVHGLFAVGLLLTSQTTAAACPARDFPNDDELSVIRAYKYERDTNRQSAEGLSGYELFACFYADEPDPLGNKRPPQSKPAPKPEVTSVPVQSRPCPSMDDLKLSQLRYVDGLQYGFNIGANVEDRELLYACFAPRPRR